MARGQEAKNAITQKILSTFEGAFVYDKEIRVPYMEAGELVQVKITLTAAKTNVDTGDEDKLPGTVEAPVTPASTSATPTQDEINNVQTLLQSLGL